MPNAREIQARMRSIRDTMKITNAMYMISSAKLRKARKELEETEPYFYALQGTLARIVRHVPDISHPYFMSAGQLENTPPGWKRGYLVVTADKGMAGAYNHTILHMAEEELGKEKDFSLMVVGEVGRQYFQMKNIPIDRHFLYTAQNPTMHRARDIAAKLLEMYEAGEVNEIYMIYTLMGNAAQTEARMERLIPFCRVDFQGAAIPLDVHREEFMFHPSVEAVMDQIIPSYLSGYIYCALVESYCSEHNARMAAMQAANDSAQEMLAHLSVAYNRVRQAAITQEITEVISGAKAQKKKRGA